MALIVCPITISDAKVFVARVHRHHKPPTCGLFAIACANEGAEEICGVAIVGRPVAIKLDDGWTAEVTRVATDGTKNACSMLYGACWRAAKAMGYRRLITYTLEEEGGGSLIASGWKNLGLCGGGTWNRKARPRIDKHPLQKKFKWERSI